jgi:hypothetical protein
VLVVVAGCGGSPRPSAPEPPPPEDPGVVVDIAPRRCEALGVDWCNHAYGTELGLDPLELHDGEWEVRIYACVSGEHTTSRFSLHTVATGDVDGDGHEDVVAAVDELFWGCEDQGSYDHTHLIAYSMVGGAPTPLGSTTAETFHSWNVSVVGREVRRVHQGGCTEQWQLDQGALVQTGTRCVTPP